MKKIFRTHPNPGALRSFADNELRGEALEQVSRHLEGCETCQETLNALQERSETLARRFSPPQSPVPSTSAARRRIDLYIQQQEVTQMSKIQFNTPLRRAAILVSLVAVLVIAFSFPQVRAIANQFLGLFRVEQVTVFDANLDDLRSRLGRSTQLEMFFNEEVQTDVSGETQNFASAEEASAALGWPVRLPDLNGQAPNLTVQPAGKMTFEIDLERARAILREIGRADIELPDDADGQTVTIAVPASLQADYGRCAPEDSRPVDPDEPEGERTIACTTLFQIPSPTITAPPSLDIHQIGLAYLELMGMTEDEALSFSENIDWTNTLVIPIPLWATGYQEVEVDGVKGQLVIIDNGYGQAKYSLIWVKEGTVYILAGPGNAEKALSLANSLK